MIGAARSPFEMIADGEDRVAAIVKVVVRVQGAQSSGLRKNGLGVVQFTREACDRLETRPAKACGIEAIGGQPGEDVIRYEDLMAPAGPLVEMAFRHATLIVTAAPRTLLVMPQAKFWRFCRRGFSMRLDPFHRIRFF